MDRQIRPLTEADLEAARGVQSRAFTELDAVDGRPPAPDPPEVVERQRGRFRHFLTHDPGGSWAATVDGEVVGAALALRRGGLWGLSLLVVDPAHQSRGLGRELLDASLQHAAGTDVAVILSSQDGRAIRRYAAAGFDLFPQVRASGPVARNRLQAPALPVRLGTAADVEFADAVDVEVRGAARGPDHERLLAQAALYVCADGGRGYAYVRPGGRVVTVAATDDATATALLWACLAHDDTPTADHVVEHLTGEQQWAVRVAVAAGLRLAPGGPVFWRGRTPPRGYIPDGAYL